MPVSSASILKEKSHPSLFFVVPRSSRAEPDSKSTWRCDFFQPSKLGKHQRAESSDTRPSTGGDSIHCRHPRNLGERFLGSPSPFSALERLVRQSEKLFPCS